LGYLALNFSCHPKDDAYFASVISNKIGSKFLTSSSSGYIEYLPIPELNSVLDDIGVVLYGKPVMRLAVVERFSARVNEGSVREIIRKIGSRSSS